MACSDTALIQAINDSNANLNDHILDLTTYCLYTLTDADGQLPTITQPLVIHGHNATIRRDPGATTNFRIFEVGGVSLTMDTLTVMNGNAMGVGNGGAVDLETNFGSLTTTDVNFQGNASDSGGAIFAGARTSLSLTRGLVNDNRTDGGGGGIGVIGLVPVFLDTVTVTGNRADMGGGAILDSTQLSTIMNSTFSHNTAVEGGGGIFSASSGTLAVTGTKIADNRVAASTDGGGGIFREAISGGSATFTNSTISGNTVTGFRTADGSSNRGGAIHAIAGPITLDNTQVAGNRLIGPFGQGAGIAAAGDVVTTTLTLQNGTTLTRNLASGRYSQGGGLYTDSSTSGVTVSVTGSHIDANKVTGTGSVSGGIYNSGGTVSLTNSSVNNNV
ncbi:hypothetical protein ABZ845_31980, partial [Streptomyces sp. NPDC047022]|uniref:hypothetical protein n=1 Tax=Streptomyces sp. NPDC047022 TaxID=3155737 RepID=UPI0033D903E7